MSQIVLLAAMTERLYVSRYYGDMVIATLQDHAYASYSLGGDGDELPAVYAELSAVPPPMIENNWDLDSECLTGEALRAAAVPELTAVRSDLCNSPHFRILS